MNVRSRILVLFALLSPAGCILDKEADAPFGGAASQPGSEGANADTEEVASDAVVAVCERIDACGFLPPGVRAADCEDSTRMCLGGALQSELSDWELVAAGCLQFENCFNFADCYEGLGSCEVTLEAGTTGSSTGEGLVDETTGGVGLDGTTGGPLEEAESSSSGEAPGESSSGDVVEPPLCEGTCDACIDCAIDDPCNPQAVACATNSDCLDLGDCYAGCDDAACDHECETLYPGGIADYDAFAGCALDVCGGSC